MSQCFIQSASEFQSSRYYIQYNDNIYMPIFNKALNDIQHLTSNENTFMSMYRVRLQYRKRVYDGVVSLGWGRGSM